MKFFTGLLVLGVMMACAMHMVDAKKRFRNVEGVKRLCTFENYAWISDTSYLHQSIINYKPQDQPLVEISSVEEFCAQCFEMMGWLTQEDCVAGKPIPGAFP